MKKTLMLILSVAFLLTSCSSSTKVDPTTRFIPYDQSHIPQQAITKNIAVYKYKTTTDKLQSSIVPAQIEAGKTSMDAALTYMFNSDHQKYAFLNNYASEKKFEIIVSGDYATVNIFGRVPNTIPEFQRYIQHMEIVNTIVSFSNINYVSVYAGNEELGSSNYYIGPKPFQNTSMTESYNEFINRSKLVDNTMSSYAPTDIPTFFSDLNGGYLIGKIRSVPINLSNKTESINELLKQIVQGPTSSNGLSSTLNKDLKYQTPVLTTANGVSTLTITFGSSPGIQGKNNEALAYGSIVNTISAVYPKIDNYKFIINGKTVTTIPTISNTTGVYTKNDFWPMVGTNIPLYFAQKDHANLIPIFHATTVAKANNPEEIISQLMAGPTSTDDPKAWPVFPKGVSQKDLLSCKNINGTLVLNFSSNFLDLCKELTPASETLMVYAITNSVTVLENIYQVQFLIEGQQFDTIIGGIDYTNPLLSNPGIVR